MSDSMGEPHDWSLNVQGVPPCQMECYTFWILCSMMHGIQIHGSFSWRRIGDLTLRTSWIQCLPRKSYNAWCKLLLPLLVMAWETLFGCPGNSIRKLGCAPSMAIWLRSTQCLLQGTFVTTRRTQTQRVRIGTRFSCDICGRNLVSWALASVNHLWGAIIHIYQVVKTTWPIKSENVIGALAGELS